MSDALHLDVFVVPYKPIVGLIPSMGEGEATWPATSVSLISGEHDAVLIDAVLTPADAGRVVDWIRATGKNLTTIYITHGHGDHFFGLNTILDAFPDARAVTAAAVIPDARTQLSPDLMSFWNAIFPGEIPEHPIVPDALDGDVLDLEGHELRIITVGQADTAPSTIVYIPSLDAVISGEALEPKTVVAGHKRPDARDDHTAAILGDTKTYIRDFDQSLSESHSAQELVDKMMVLHGDLGNPVHAVDGSRGRLRAGTGSIVMSRLATQPARASGEFAIGGDLPVVRPGYGAMRIPGPGVWGEPRDHDEVIRVLRRALELGVTFIDTADSYGPEVSERLIREALHPYPDGLVIATKAGFTRPGPDRWERNGKPEYLKAQAERSLRLLGLERIELFQLHRIDPEVPLADQLGALIELQELEAHS